MLCSRIKYRVTTLAPRVAKYCYFVLVACYNHYIVSIYTLL